MSTPHPRQVLPVTITGDVKKGVPRLAAGLLRAGQHEIRRPGESAWLPVELVERTPVGLRVIAGGREFLTDRLTKWPVRVQVVDS